MKHGDGMRAASRAYEKKVAKLRAQWVPGSEMTPAQLEATHRALKADFLAREERRRAA
jgi:hypothetical protein